MRASKGGLTHAQIMALTWRQFWLYMDAFVYLLREEYEDGRIQNKKDDLRAMSTDPRLKERKKKMVEETKRAVEKHKKFAEQKNHTGVKHNMLE